MAHVSQGTYERQNKLCQDIDSLSFIDKIAASESTLASDALSCADNTQYNEIITERRCITAGACVDVSVQNTKQGAKLAADCSCQHGFYTPASLSSLASSLENYAGGAALAELRCLPCPEGAECMGNIAPPIARPGYMMSAELVPLPHSDSGYEPVFLECNNREQCLTIDREELYSVLATFEKCLESDVDYNSCIASVARENRNAIAEAAGTCDCERPRSA